MVDILIDKSDMKQMLENFPQQMKEAIKIGKDIVINDNNIKSICVAGLGGSGFAGDLIKVYLKDLQIPIFVVKDYTLPAYINQDTLLFVISYSGNTEETVSCYRAGLKRSCQVISITSGGKIEELSKINNSIHISVPKNMPPRLSTPYLFFPMLNILENNGIIDDQSAIINNAIDSIKKASFFERAQDFAEKLKGKIPIIYSSTQTRCIAEKWKTDINENAKTPAFANIFPEFNHNEINSYNNLVGKYHVIMISDTDDHPRIKDRFRIVKGLIKSKGVDVTEINIKGENFLSRLMSGIYMGLWLSYWLSLVYETDPTPVKIIEDLKKELKK